MDNFDSHNKALSAGLGSAQGAEVEGGCQEGASEIGAAQEGCHLYVALEYSEWKSVSSTGQEVRISSHPVTGEPSSARPLSRHTHLVQSNLLTPHAIPFVCFFN